MPLIATLNLSAVQADQAPHHLFCSANRAASCQGCSRLVRSVCQDFRGFMRVVRTARLLHVRTPFVTRKCHEGIPTCRKSTPISRKNIPSAAA